MRLHHLAATVCAVTAAVTAGLLLPAAPALAHNELRAATPADKASLTAAPRQVVLEFAERLDPRYTTIAVTAAGGDAVAPGKPQVAGVRATQPLPGSLAGGAYTVSFRVVSVDGHPVQGSTTFTVTASAAAVATPSPSAAAASQPPTPPAGAANAQPGSGDDSAGGAVVTLMLVVLGLLVVAAIVLVGRRRRAAGVPPR